MTLNEQPYLFLTVFLVAALAFALVPLGLARLWAKVYSPSKPGPSKNATYECGLESPGSPGGQFHARYYLFGILFLIFDVELLFLLPFAVAFPELSIDSIVIMLLFLLLLVEGLVWAWMKGVLSWR
jgi:NADH:ubiquinone oxidoreductase subunit 3 (subunit A)